MIEAITAQVNVQTIVGVVAVIATACIGMVFMWWGARKATGGIMSAFRKGKLSI